MRGYTHLLGGCLAALLLCAKSPPAAAEAPWVIAAGGFGGLLPDIDHPNSMISRSGGAVTKTVSSAVRGAAGHRGACHSLLFVCTVYCIMRILLAPHLSFLTPSICLAVALGSLSHLALDFLTTMGVPWFWPLSKKKLSLLPAKTGGVFEILVFLGMLAAVVFLASSGFPVNTGLAETSKALFLA